MYKFCKFRFDPENHVLEGDGHSVLLTPKAFDILLVLIRNGSGLTTKEELMRKVWPDSFVEDANLTVNISALRKQLGEAPKGSQYIQTVPKKGYRFGVPVSHIEPDHHTGAMLTEKGEKQVPDAVLAPRQEPVQQKTGVENLRGQKHGFKAGVVVLGIVAVLMAGLEYRTSKNKALSRRNPRSLQRSLAVLPFRNLEGNADLNFLGLSLANAVITKLGYVSDLTVRPSFSVQKYSAQTIDIPTIAADLNVDTLLTGAVFREGDKLHITCQLIDVQTDTLLWKRAFEVKYNKLRPVQDEVAQRVIQDLELTLPPPEADKPKTVESVDPLAYEYYLRGVDLYANADYSTAVSMLEKSTELAPHFALAWAKLGRSYNANASFQFGGTQHYDRAEIAFSRALALQPNDIDARIYMANLFTDTGKVEQAVPLLREALKTDPNNAEIHWELGYAYRFAGMLSEAVFECELARRIDPGVKLNSSTSNAYLYLGQYDRFLKSLPTDETALIVFYRGLGEYYEKDFKHAELDFDHAFELDRSLLQAQTGKAMGFGIRGRIPDADAILRGLEAKINQRGVVDPEAMYKVAQAYAMIGDRTAALRVLRKSIDNGFFPYSYFATDSLLNNVRKESTFATLLDAAHAREEKFRGSFF